MTSSSQADAMATYRLLGLGVLAGPIYLVVGIAQALLRDGFVFAKHPSACSRMDRAGGCRRRTSSSQAWMVVATAVGFRRALGPRSGAVSLFLGAFGASMLVAAVFRADPMDGFPVGTPNGPPTTISGTGLVHFAAGGLGFVSLAVSCLVAAWVMSRRNVPSLAGLSLLAGVIILLGFFSGMAIPGSSPVVGIWIAVVVGWRGSR